MASFFTRHTDVPCEKPRSAAKRREPPKAARSRGAFLLVTFLVAHKKSNPRQQSAETQFTTKENTLACTACDSELPLSPKGERDVTPTPAPTIHPSDTRNKSAPPPARRCRRPPPSPASR